MKTIYKIKVAKLIFNILMLCGINQKQLLRRSSINWNLDLSEGIDLSIYIFGSFQNDISSSILKLVKKIVKNNKDKINFIDVGSNIGDKSLFFARNLLNQNIQNFHVHSIEPTEFAFNKQKKNLSLNKILSKKISLHNYFISNRKKKNVSTYSSWNLKKNNNSHNIHGGVLKKIKNNTKNSSLDNFIKKFKINDNIIIKIDVDGFELNVLKSCEKQIRSKNIIFFMEYAPYAFNEHGRSIKEFFIFIKKNNLMIYDLNFSSLNQIKIGEGQSIDIIIAKKNFFSN